MVLPSHEIPYNKKAIIILDGLLIPDFLKRTMSLGHTFNHPDTSVSDMKRTMIEELLRIANLFNNIEDIVVTDPFSLKQSDNALIQDVKTKSWVRLLAQRRLLKELGSLQITSSLSNF